MNCHDMAVGRKKHAVTNERGRADPYVTRWSGRPQVRAVPIDAARVRDVR